MQQKLRKVLQEKLYSICEYCYTVKNHCVEDNSIDIDDGITSIYLSTMGRNYEEVSTELISFLNKAEKWGNFT